MYDELERLAELQPGDRLLEVGCGTGQATAALVRRGFRITCFELGGALAEVARRNLAPFADVRILHAAFEDRNPGPAPVFDLVFAATAWPRPGELPDDRTEIEACGLFEVLAVRQFDWEVFTLDELAARAGAVGFAGIASMPWWDPAVSPSAGHPRVQLVL
ncbi:MAG: class I SAM-dependent methyltransferase [Mycobacteriales bacterium]